MVDSVEMNKDLARERDRCTFDVEKLTHIIYGGPQKTRRKRYLENIILQDPVFKELRYFDTTTDRGEQYEETLQRHVYLLKRMHDLGINDKNERLYLQQMVLPHIVGTFNLHASMFTETLQQHGTDEQKKKWLPKAANMEIIGTYAQTEIGHGSFVRGLETTATYDEITKEFIINSPRITSLKYWPGNLGKTANACVLMAQLYTKGKCYGVHPFLVPIRSLEDHQPLEGIEVGDIGPKLGYTNVTNGFLRLTNYRIPRENMLMRYSKVTEDGRYEPPPNTKLTYGTMVSVRAILAKRFALVLAEACTIAIRYSAVRRQTESKPGGEELQILDYQTQQMKLFTHLANAYAIYFAGDHVIDIYNQVRLRIEKGDLSDLPQLHALTASLKAFCTNLSLTGVEECRMACGGHGYSHASGFPKIYAQAAQAPIVEGESTILYLQAARYLVKSCQRIQKGEKLPGFLSYLNRSLDEKSNIDEQLELETLVAAFQHRASRLIRRASLSVHNLTAGGHPAEVAWNLSGAELTKAAKAFCEAYIVGGFVEYLNKPQIDDVIRRVLTSLCKLYAVNGLHQHMGDFIQDGYINSKQVDCINNKLFDLLSEIRPQAVGLVDAFDFPDVVMGSCLGRYDGQVYNALYEFAKSSSFNQSDVHPSYYKYLQPLVERSDKDAFNLTAKL